jgi:periplasmic divalent cation tolerance protein
MDEDLTGLDLTPAQPDEVPIAAFTTFPDLETARGIAHALLQDNLVACVNLLPGATSIYRWEGEVEENTEVVAIVKTAEDRVPALLERLTELHPYDVPELVFLPIVAGSADYLDWVVASTR